MLTGVAGACVLGVAAGLWARPMDTERRGVMIARPAAAPPQRQLQIVVDDTPAPIGDPMEVLSQEASRPQPNFALPPPLPVIQPSAGLMKVTATAPLQVSEPPESEAPPAPRRIEPVPRVVLKAAAPKPAKAVLARPRIKAGTSEKKAVPTLAKPAKVARSEPVKIAKVKPRAEAKARPKTAKLVLAKAETKARPEARLQTARKQAATAEANRKLVQAMAEKRAEAAKAAKLAKASQAKVAKVAQAREAWLAKLAAAEKARAAENLRVARAAGERRQAQVKLAAVKRAKAQAASKAKAAGLRVAA
ncbi:MAG: hypothetical protein JWO33_997, partial [Caulobacteraceae bacterium]|nr:hypothetical protein [Caulobacteraceae bacterium]